jgi:hypothetical protein
MPYRVCAIVLACLLAAVRTGAQDSRPDPHAAQPERPSVATHAGTVAPGWIEMETGLERDVLDGAISYQVPTLVKLGLAPRVQLGVQLPAVTPAGAGTGVGDVAFAVKWRVREQTRAFGDVAIQPSLKLPTGSAIRATGTGTTDLGLLFISSRDLGPVSMDLNAGYTRRSGDGTAAPRSATLWAASFGGPAAGALGWGAELFGYPATTGPAGAPSVIAFLGGPTCTVREWLVLDAGVILPIAGPQPKAVFFGGVYNIGRIAGAARR